jgi:hypothetical protein
MDSSSTISRLSFQRPIRVLCMLTVRSGASSYFFIVWTERPTLRTRNGSTWPTSRDPTKSPDTLEATQTHRNITNHPSPPTNILQPASYLHAVPIPPPSNNGPHILSCHDTALPERIKCLCKARARQLRRHKESIGW